MHSVDTFKMAQAIVLFKIKFAALEIDQELNLSLIESFTDEVIEIASKIYSEQIEYTRQLNQRPI